MSENPTTDEKSESPKKTLLASFEVHRIALAQRDLDQTYERYANACARTARIFRFLFENRGWDPDEELSKAWGLVEEEGEVYLVEQPVRKTE